MRTRRLMIGLAAVAAIGAGTAGAGAATGGFKDDEQEILDNAAERLGVTADELRDALEAAQDDQLDAAVKAGELTREQADAIKQHRDRAGTVLGFGHRGPGGPFGGPGGHHGPRPGGMFFDEIAEALGIEVGTLFDRLRDGETLAEIVKAEGTTLAEVRAAVRAAAIERLDAAVTAGRLTKEQRDEIVEHLDAHLERLGDAPPPFRGGPGFGGHHGPPPRMP